MALQRCMGSSTGRPPWRDSDRGFDPCSYGKDLTLSPSGSFIGVSVGGHCEKPLPLST